MPSLKHISKKLQISQSFAGTTFLALGNGFPDLAMSIFMGFNLNKTSSIYIVGSIYGAGLCCFCLIVPAILRFYP